MQLRPILQPFCLAMALISLTPDAFAAPPAYSVVIDSASAKAGTVSLSGSVSSTDAVKTVTSVNIDLLPPAGAAVRLASNVAVIPGSKSPFNWTGALPGVTSIAPGSQIRVSAVIEAVAPVMPIAAVSLVMQLTGSNAPVAPDGMKLACSNPIVSTNSAASEKCPVVVNNGISYWPYGYLDKRNAVSLVGFNINGQIVSQQDINGINNIFKIDFDEAKQTLTLWSQSNGKSVLPWLPGPSVVQLPTAKAPPAPAGMRALCMTGANSPAPDGPADKCPAVIENGVTYWPFAYNDNRVSVGWVGYDANNQVVSNLELPGARYLWKISTETADKTITLWGQATGKIVLQWGQIPLVKDIDVSKAPPLPAGLQLYCSTGPNSPAAPVSKTCPVLLYRGLAYWPFSYRDNRSALALVSYTNAGKFNNQQDLAGTRYAWKTSVDSVNRKVVFSGQGGKEVVLPWGDLK